MMVRVPPPLPPSVCVPVCLPPRQSSPKLAAMLEAEQQMEAAVMRIGKVATGDLSPVTQDEGGLFEFFFGGSGEKAADPYAVSRRPPSRIMLHGEGRQAGTESQAGMGGGANGQARVAVVGWLGWPGQEPGSDRAGGVGGRQEGVQHVHRHREQGPYLRGQQDPRALGQQPHAGPREGGSSSSIAGEGGALSLLLLLGKKEEEADRGCRCCFRVRMTRSCGGVLTTHYNDSRDDDDNVEGDCRPPCASLCQSMTPTWTSHTHAILP